MSAWLEPRRRAMLAEMGIVMPPVRDAVEPGVDQSPPPSPPTSSSAPPTARLTPLRAPESVSTPSPAGVEVAGPVAHMDWTSLQQAVSQCQACSLCQQRRNTVFGTGAPDPTPGQAPQVDWMIVGEAPGENEDIQGEPFVGQAGLLLDNMLKAVGLVRHAEQAPGGRVYIANVLKCRPPGNRNPHPDEVARCEPYLQRQVALLKPRIIIAMGRFAVQSLLRESVPQVEAQPLGRLRGQVYNYQGVPVVVTYHPAYLLRNLADKRKAWSDLCLALSVAGRPQG
jgi:uracil-DNA glycosylase family 4